MARNKFDVDEDLDSVFDQQKIKRLFSYIIPFKWRILGTVLLMLTASAASLTGPYLIKQAIDSKIPNGDYTGLALLAGLYLLGLVWTGTSLKFRIRSMSFIGQNIIQNIRKDLFAHLQKLSFHYYDSRPHGKILVRVVNYVNALSDLLSNGIINVITDLFSLVVIIGFMIAINPKLTLVAMLGFPVLVTFIMLIKKAQRRAWQQLSNKQSNLNAYLHESLEGIKITQSFTRERENERIFHGVSEEYRKSWMHMVRIQFLLWTVVENISILTVSAIYLTGIHYFTDVSAGELVAFIGYIWMFWQPITNIGNFYNAIINAMAYLERIFETIDEPIGIRNASDAKEMPAIVGHVKFEDVVFRYEESGKSDVLNHINFEVQPGETVALVGATGSGKTTMVSLISRFYDVLSGSVKIDGIDVRTVNVESLRSQMGVMLQEPFIFSGTIMDNIRYGKLDATDEEVIAAAKAVEAHHFIMAMQDGYLTEVQERGTRLSVGQRQLISFARALLANPKILILDEATSSIDTETEMELQKGLERLLVGRTSFIIAHRLSTIRNATKIFVINEGAIIEMGNHAQLINQQGAYYNLYMAQQKWLQGVQS